MYSKDFKQKYFLLCREKKLEIKKYSDLLAQEVRKRYICKVINIKEI
jgi:hypothetical protein